MLGLTDEIRTTLLTPRRSVKGRRHVSVMTAPAHD